MKALTGLTYPPRLPPSKSQNYTDYPPRSQRTTPTTPSKSQNYIDYPPVEVTELQLPPRSHRTTPTTPPRSHRTTPTTPLEVTEFTLTTPLEVTQNYNYPPSKSQNYTDYPPPPRSHRTTPTTPPPRSHRTTPTTPLEKLEKFLAPLFEILNTPLVCPPPIIVHPFAEKALGAYFSD